MTDLSAQFEITSFVTYCIFIYSLNCIYFTYKKDNKKKIDLRLDEKKIELNNFNIINEI